MSIERNNGVLLLEVKEDDSIKYVPHFIRESEEDAVSGLIIQEKGKLKQREQDFICPIDELTGHGRRQGRRNIRDIQEYRKRELPKIRAKLNVLEGKSFKPVRIIEEQVGEKKRQTVRVSDFISGEEREWWEFAKDSQLLPEVKEIFDRFPEGISYLREYHNIRDRVSRAITVRDEDEINKDWSSFNQKLREMDVEKADRLLPVIRKISDSFRIPAWYRKP